MRQGDWKLVQFYGDNHLELYNLKSDIKESKNLVDLFPQRVANMLLLLNNWKKSTRARLPMLNPYYNPNYEELIKTKDMTRHEFMLHYDSLFSEEVYDPHLFKSIMKRNKEYIKEAEERNGH